mgnify:FL=1
MKFPEHRVEIEARLLAVEMLQGWGRNELERMLNGKPAVSGVGRDWKSSDELLAVSAPPAAEAASPQMEERNLGGEDMEVSNGIQ